MGRWSGNNPFWFWLNNPLERPGDLAGRKMRTAGLYDEFMRALGIIPVTVSMPEVYSALERGIVEGFGWPMQGPVDYGWTEKAKFCIDHPFYEQNSTIVMNLDVWNGLPKHRQDIILDSAVKSEREMWDANGRGVKEHRQKALDDGVTFVKFSPADAEYYLKLAYSTSWEVAKGKVSPEMYAKLYELLRK